MRSNTSLERTRDRQSAKLERRRARRSAQPLGLMRTALAMSAGAVAALSVGVLSEMGRLALFGGILTPLQWIQHFVPVGLSVGFLITLVIPFPVALNLRRHTSRVAASAITALVTSLVVVTVMYVSEEDTLASAGCAAIQLAVAWFAGCWVMVRLAPPPLAVMRPNTSFERTREG